MTSAKGVTVIAVALAVLALGVLLLLVNAGHDSGWREPSWFDVPSKTLALP